MIKKRQEETKNMEMRYRDTRRNTMARIES
jgi:hypothetical protein